MPDPLFLLDELAGFVELDELVGGLVELELAEGLVDELEEVGAVDELLVGVVVGAELEDEVVGTLELLEEGAGSDELELLV